MRWNGEGTEHNLHDYDARNEARLQRLGRLLVPALAWLLTALVAYVLLTLVAAVLAMAGLQAWLALYLAASVLATVVLWAACAVAGSGDEQP
jgi:lipopolysaccharide export LptBFGC system permease protein LptF